MFYLEKTINLSDFDRFSKILVVFRYYKPNKGLYEIITNTYEKKCDQYFVTINELSQDEQESHLITDTGNMLAEINEWISHGYFCNEKGSIVMYVLAEEKKPVESSEFFDELKRAGIKDFRDLITRANQAVLIERGLMHKEEFSEKERREIKEACELLLKNTKLVTPFLKELELPNLEEKEDDYQH